MPGRARHIGSEQHTVLGNVDKDQVVAVRRAEVIKRNFHAAEIDVERVFERDRWNGCNAAFSDQMRRNFLVADCDCRVGERCRSTDMAHVGMAQHDVADRHVVAPLEFLFDPIGARSIAGSYGAVD